MPQTICDVICNVGIGIGIAAAAADSIGYRVPARYQSNPRLKSTYVEIQAITWRYDRGI